MNNTASEKMAYGNNAAFARYPNARDAPKPRLLAAARIPDFSRIRKAEAKKLKRAASRSGMVNAFGNHFRIMQRKTRYATQRGRTEAHEVRASCEGSLEEGPRQDERKNSKLAMLKIKIRKFNRCRIESSLPRFERWSKSGIAINQK